MTNQFCTSCGHSVAMDANFCDDCGSVFENADSYSSNPDTPRRFQTTPLGSAKHAVVIKRAHSMVSTWVMPFNATLVFGTTLVGVFDFLSPRVALLPIAATVAVVGLMSALALRKFVAASLPMESRLRRALAPEMGVHKSPILIATGLLSALMVSGAAWSNVNATEGGIIASKFDAARVAQMQIGILQSMQKEQRQQTGVLEDIREGRAADPRRELSNIGGGFNSYELDAAIDRGDSRTVQLLLAGGLKWRLANVYPTFANNDSKMSDLLLENKSSFELRDGDCERLIEQKFGATQPFEIIGGVIQTPIDLSGQSTVDLKPFQKKIMRMFCAKPEVQAFVKGKLINEQQTTASAKASSQKLMLGLSRSRDTCVANRISQRANELDDLRLRRKYSTECYSSDCSSSSDRLGLAAHDEKKYAQVVQDVCSEEYQTPQATGAVKRDMTVIYKQILDSIS